MSSGGFFVRVGGGPTLVVGEIYVPGQSRIIPTLNLTLGWKLM